MKIAVLQIQAAPGDVTANLTKIETAAGEAAAKGAQILIAPELALPGYGAGEAMQDLAEPVEGPQVEALRKIAGEQQIAIVAGFAERDNDQVYNSLVMVEAGKAPVIYRKTHLYGDYEKNLFSAGAIGAVLHSFAGLKLGFLICYDVEFPENVRRLALAGADVVLVPTALPLDGYSDFITSRVVPVRAFENQVFLAYANHAGSDGRFTYAGRSCVAAPDGSLLAASDDNAESLILAEIRPEDYAESRAANAYLADLSGGSPSK